MTVGIDNDTLYGGDDASHDALILLASGFVDLAVGTVVTSFGGSVAIGFEGIAGSSGNDTVYGTDGANVVNVYGGNNTVRAHGGDDILVGGAGDDILDGGSGNDAIDYINHTVGVTIDLATSLATGWGNDTLAGIERVNATDYIDTVYGGDLDNGVSVHDGDDTVFGRGGVDLINGQGGNDVLFGGGGVDSLSGGDGNDWLAGDEGDDTLVGGLGIDVADYSGTATPVVVNLATGTATGGAGADQLVEIENATGGTGADVLTGDGAANGLEGGGGNDTIYGAGGNDTIYGPGGNDIIAGYTGVDTFHGGDGNDIFRLGETYGEIGPDTLFGGAGDDTITATGAIAAGTAVTSVERFEVGLHVEVAAGFLDSFAAVGSEPGYNNDVTLTHTTAGNTSADFVAGLTGTFQGSVGADAFTLPATAGTWLLVGNDGDDTLTAGGNNDALQGGNGNDTLAGAGGVDTVSGGADNDVVLGGIGADTLWGDLGNDTVSGGEGNDTIYGNEGVDTLSGDGDDDQVSGGDANDTVSGDLGNDTLFGDLGDDTVGGGDGNDTIYGNEGIDTLSGDADSDLISGGDGDDTVSGGLGGDTLLGDLGVDTVSGGDGNDTLRGGDGLDTLAGDAGDDFAYAEAGNDTVDGGAGNDTVLGEIGDDVVSGGIGNDTADGGSGNDLVHGDAGDDTAYGADGNDILRGGAGEDTLYGGTGVDAQFGGAGDDVFYADVADVTVRGGTGADTIVYSTGSDTVVGAHELRAELILLDAGDDVFAPTSSATPWASSVSLSSLDGTTGFRLDGATANDWTGYSVSGAGDVNGDGYDDVIVGALGLDVNGSSSGGAYVVFGKASGWSASTDLSSLDGSTGFRLLGVAAIDIGGHTVSAAGDVDGDGYDDLILSGPQADPNGSNSGSTYVVFGKASGWTADVVLSSLDGTTGFRLDGAAANDLAGNFVSLAGDVNGDGYDDMLVAASYTDHNGANSGSVYVVFGKPSGWASSVNLSSLDGTTGFRLDGTAVEDLMGAVQASAGDVNGDGYDDVIVGAYQADPNGIADSGAAYVVFGKASGWAASVNLSSLDGATGFRLAGAAANDRAGARVSSAGDVNGDGYDDVIVGAYLADPDGAAESGATYVVFGKASGWAASVNLSSLDGATGFRLDGGFANDQTAYSVSSAGDVDGDGYDDLIIGARFADASGTSSGEAYVVFGKASGWTASLDLSGLDGTTGFRVPGVAAFDETGTSVSAAGDVDDDGFDDLIVGGYLADPHGVDSGAAYVIFGHASRTPAYAIDGGAGNDTITGEAGADTLYGGTGNDSLYGGDGNDTLAGGAGDESLSGGGGNDTFVGGVGNDTLAGGAGGADRVDYGAIAAGVLVDLLAGTVDKGDDGLDRLSGIEILDGSATDDRIVGDNLANTFFGRDGDDQLSGAGGNDVLSGNEGGDTLTGGSGGDTLAGEDGDDLLQGGSGNDALAGGEGADDLFGGTDTDTLAGDAGDDTLDGGSGNDALAGGGDDDALYGGDNDDTLVGGLGNDTLVGGAGIDWADYAAAASGTTLTGSSAVGGDGIDVLAQFENFRGSAFGDTVTGDDLANILEGGAGNDSLDGSLGVDTMVGGIGNDLFQVRDTGDVVTESTGQGTDQVNVRTSAAVTIGDNVESIYVLAGFAGTVAAGNTLDKIFGGAGVDSFTGGAGDDTMYGYDGNDTLRGGVDNDFFDGMAGDDSLDGGAGNDTLDGGTAAGNDTMSGGTGNDTYQVRHGGDAVIELGGEGTDQVNVRTAQAVTIGDNVETIYALDAAGSTISAGNTLDKIYGGAATDVLDGNGGNDSLYGYGGADTLAGGVGNDLLYGGTSSDVFVYAAGDGNDQIADVEAGDVVDLTGVTFASAAGRVATLSDGATITAQVGWVWTGAEFI